MAPGGYNPPMARTNKRREYEKRNQWKPERLKAADLPIWQWEASIAPAAVEPQFEGFRTAILKQNGRLKLALADLEFLRGLVKRTVQDGATEALIAEMRAYLDETG